MQKKETRYIFVVPVRIYVACSLYKLGHGVEDMHFSEMFTINKSIVHLVLCEFGFVVNVVFQSRSLWLEQKDLVEVMRGFKKLYDMLSIHGAINVMHIHIQKPWYVLLVTIFLSSQKLTCNYKLWLIIKINFRMSLWECLTWWMMFKYYTFLVYLWRLWMEPCFISAKVKRTLGFTWLLTRVIPCFFG